MRFAQEEKQYYGYAFLKVYRGIYCEKFYGLKRGRFAGGEKLKIKVLGKNTHKPLAAPFGCPFGVQKNVKGESGKHRNAQFIPLKNLR